ncbi:hypothetical protein LXL04_031483 [Taraxacum kok-saghyz]
MYLADHQPSFCHASTMSPTVKRASTFGGHGRRRLIETDSSSGGSYEHEAIGGVEPRIGGPCLTNGEWDKEMIRERRNG